MCRSEKILLEYADDAYADDGFDGEYMCMSEHVYK